MTIDLCTAGDFTTRLSRIYVSHIATLAAGQERGLKQPSTTNTSQLAHAFACEDLPFSRDEVSDILKVAAENVLGETAKGVSWWGVFCVCCVELAAQKHGQTHPQQKALILSGGRLKKTGSAMSLGRSAGVSCEYDVFLGGSCNPTSWRKDIVIPYLQKEGITYYNPQVDEWYPELIEIEEQAKEAASRLLYVIDDQTRAVASMVEVADFVGSSRDVLVVVDDITGEAPVISGDRVSRREMEDLNRGRAFVRNITDRSGCLVEETVHKALMDISRWGQCAPEDTPSSQISEESTPPSTVLFTTKLRLLQKVYSMYDTGRRGHLSLEEAEQALFSVSCDRRSVDTVWRCNAETSDWIQWRENGVSLETFSVLYTEAKYRTLVAAGSHSHGVFSTTAQYVRAGIQQLSGWLWSLAPPSSTPSHPPHTHYDVYLGGSCGTTSWRHDDIIPILQQHGVTFFNPQVPHWDTSLITIEQTAKDQCSVLLFVIGAGTLSVGSMVEVAYYMGCDRRLVLVLNDIPQPQEDKGFTLLEGMKLSTKAVRDYNRGRAYLASIAHKREVPTYSSVIDGALCAVYMVKGYQLPRHSADNPLQGTSV